MTKENTREVLVTQQEVQLKQTYLYKNIFIYEQDITYFSYEWDL